MTEAETRLREALRDVDATDPASAALVLGLARVVTFRADATEMIAWTDRALEIAAARGDPAVLAEAASLRAHALSFRNRFAESLTYLAWASDLLGPDGPYELRIRVLSNRGVALLGADRPEAREVIETALDTARRAGDVVSTHLCTTVLSALDVIQGRWEEAEQRLLDGLEETETTPEGAVRHATLVDLYSQKGDVQSARRHLQRLADWARSDDAWLTVSYAQLEVFTAAGAGDHAGVLDLATPALRAALRFGLFDDGVRSTWPVTMEAALRCARLDVAAELLATVADAPPGLVPPFLRAHLSRFRGRLRAASGRHDGVEQDLRAAVAELGALGYPYWRAVAQADLGEWLLGQGREDEARPLLDEAATNLRNLGAQPVLRRVEALLAAHRLAGAPS
jgi:tetratricopeptide (TPR) repeat protein